MLTTAGLANIGTTQRYKGPENSKHMVHLIWIGKYIGTLNLVGACYRGSYWYTLVHFSTHWYIGTHWYISYGLIQSVTGTLGGPC